MIPQLDRLRGLAILLVLANHIGTIVPSALSVVLGQGWLGVDVFFVLSGFLITGLLWDARATTNYFVPFYGRRVLRIWPAYIVVLILAFCILPLFRRTLGGAFLDVHQQSLGLWAFLLMIQNFFATRLFLSPILVVTWSLAIEEQFYLVWPFVIRYASRAVALPGLFAALLIFPVLRVMAIHRGIPQLAIHANPLTHGDGLVCGAIIAIGLRSAKPKRRTLLVAGITLFAVGFGLFLLLRPHDLSTLYCSPLLYTDVALLSSGMLLVALVSENAGHILHRFFFMNRTLAFLGFISYSLYLYHFFILRSAARVALMASVDRWHHPRLTLCLMEAIAVSVSILLAWLSRVTLERAALSRKHLFRQGPS
ncbi:MAG: acyltransferase [Terracidiphilus sp.]